MNNDIFNQAEKHIGIGLIERYFSAHDSKHAAYKNEYYTQSPLRPDQHSKSGTFSIRTDTGVWNDIVTGEKGNFIQLVSKAFNISLLESAQKIIDDSGGVYNMPDNKSVKKEKKPAIVPIPQGSEKKLSALVQNSFNSDLHGIAKKIYPYKNITGETYFCVCRYEKESTDENGSIVKSKEIIPYYFTADGWAAGRPGIKKLPLFHSEKIKPGSLVLVVEGEKCACVEIDGWIIITWCGGTGSVKKSDWSVLQDMDVIIWPDADEPGLKAAMQIKQMLPQSEILNIIGKPKTWDISNAEVEGIDLIKFIDNCPRIIEKELPTNPYDTFCRIVDEIYGHENLEQFDGIYYIYKENKHYWEERLQTNIESDIQKWVTRNQYEFLQANDMAIHTFVRNTASFLQRYSRDFYIRNPFKDSAIQPYIHVRNGAIEIKDEGFIFHSREEKGEKFFRDLFPLICLDIDFDMKYYKNDNLSEYAPSFNYYIQSLIPDAWKGNTEEKEKTYQFFSQILAYCLNPIKRKPRFFAMYGGQGTGKSFFVELLETIIGSQFFVSRRLKEMEESRFSAADLWGSKIFLDDDVKANITIPDDFVKTYTGQKSITIEKKNRDSIKGVKISIAMFLISNHKFTVAGGTEGIERRLIYIPYKKKISKPDVYLKDKIIGLHKKGIESTHREGSQFDERAAIIGFALRGLDLLIKNDHDFIMPIWVDREREQWLINSSSISQFLHEEIYPGAPTFYGCKELHEKYTYWCKDEGIKTPYGRNNFYEKLIFEDQIERKHDSGGDKFIVSKKINEDELLDSIPF